MECKDKPISPAQARALSLGMRLRYAHQDKGISISALAKKLNLYHWLSLRGRE